MDPEQNKEESNDFDNEDIHDYLVNSMSSVLSAANKLLGDPEMSDEEAKKSTELYFQHIRDNMSEEVMQEMDKIMPANPSTFMDNIKTMFSQINDRFSSLGAEQIKLPEVEVSSLKGEETDITPILKNNNILSRLLDNPIFRDSIKDMKKTLPKFEETLDQNNISREGKNLMKKVIIAGASNITSGYDDDNNLVEKPDDINFLRRMFKSKFETNDKIEKDDRCYLCISEVNDENKNDFFLVDTSKCCGVKAVLCKSCIDNIPSRCILRCTNEKGEFIRPNKYM